jgi:DNA-binding PadR family transcriptional regulator
MYSHTDTFMRVTYPTAIVLQALANGHGYGFEIIDVTGLGAGTVYPILRRLEAGSYVRSSWERVAKARAEGRPARRNYRLTASGVALATETASRYPGLAALLAGGEGAGA